MNSLRFHRAPRDYPAPLPTEEIVLVAPPAPYVAQGGAASWFQYLIPLFGVLGSVIFVIIYHNILMLIASGVMILGSVGGGIVVNVSQRRLQKRQSQEREQRYRDHLHERQATLDQMVQRQQEVQRQRDPEPTALLDLCSKRRRVWERRPRDYDFLQVRVGTGSQPLSAPLRLDGKGDPLQETTALRHEAEALVRHYAQVPSVPFTVDLAAGGVVSLCGEATVTRDLARALLCQIAALHAPQDARIVAYFPATATPAWSWLKWLPHTRCLQQGQLDTSAEYLCMLAYQAEEFSTILATQIAPLIEQRRHARGASEQGNLGQRQTPHLIIVLDAFTLESTIARHPLLADLFAHAAAVGVTLLCLLEHTTDEPTTTRTRLVLAGNTLDYYELHAGGKHTATITRDGLLTAQCEELARALTPLEVVTETAQYDMQQDVPLLPLLGIPSAHMVRRSEVWHARSRKDLLRVPIGMTDIGVPLFLDFKEAEEGGMGPHGLIIGATGSGKSELLRTMVTGLSLTHDPETLNFVLADFKGGASFAEFAALPHVVGMITNLQSDLTLVDRMRGALIGEQERRQQLLREAGNISTIAQYQARRAFTPDMVPMPYLLVIVDEFAELLANRPEFLDVFTAIGRVGRSLGMHLLLATQRLGEGRIQALEGHLRYRLCLRTFSAAESSAVLGTADAFYLPPYPGVGYCKVDTTLYQRFKSAITSTPAPLPSAVTKATPLVRAFTATGKLLRWEQSAPTDAAVMVATAPRTAMDVVVERLVQTDTPDDVHQVWLPPLGNHIALEQLLHRATSDSLRIPIGLLDDPLHQRQLPFVLDLIGAQGHVVIVGAPQSGKSTLLQTIIAALAATHSPTTAQMYAIDLGGGRLSRFEATPHMGAIIYKGEPEKMRRLSRQMRAIIEERERLFRVQRIESIEIYRQRRAAGEFSDHPFAPDVFLIIDDLAQVQASVDEIDVEIVELAATGLAYGVHLIITASRWADVRLKLRDHFGTRLELRLNDVAESEMQRASAQAILQAPAGRGIIKSGLQFQVALPVLPEQEMALTPGSSRSAAPPLRLLPPLVTAHDISTPQLEIPGVVIGIDEFELAPVAVDLIGGGPHFILLGDAECGKTTLIRTWLEGLKLQYSPEQMRFSLIDYRRGLVEYVESPHLLSYACTPIMLKDTVEQLRAALEPRLLRGDKVTLADLRQPQRWSGPHHCLFIDDYDALTVLGTHPLAPLFDLVTQARDIGFHLIMTRRVGGLARATTDPLLQRLKELGSPGLVMNGDPQEGLALGTQRAYPQPPGRGFLVRRNQRTLLIQTVYTPQDFPV